MSEPLSIIAIGALAVLTPPQITDFWLVVGALLAMLAMQGVFWLMTQPMNKRWMRNAKLEGVSKTFFKAGPSLTLSDDWQTSDQWERSHVVRALLSFVALTLLVISSSI